MHVFFLCEHLADGDPHGPSKRRVRRYSRITASFSQILTGIKVRQRQLAQLFSRDYGKEPKHGAVQTPA
jgi:hypothetical protein